LLTIQTSNVKEISFMKLTCPNIFGAVRPSYLDRWESSDSALLFDNNSLKEEKWG